VLAVPVGAAEALAALAGEFDEIVCLEPADPLWAIGYWYEDFGQVGDDEVAGLLERAGAPAYGGP
jgi:predicted phosphoribosyltransferase